jgi:YggT family protein
MNAVGVVLGWVLTLFVVLMLVRLVVDWAGLMTTTPSWVRRVRAVTYAGTEPVIAPVRRVLRPVRAGGIGIDLAFTAVFVLALILRSVAFSL